MNIDPPEVPSFFFTLISLIGQKETQYSPVMPIRNIERLPWTPKVRQKDIDQFLDATRNKFIGFTLPEDHESLAGLPQPIHEGFKTLQQVLLFINRFSL